MLSNTINPILKRIQKILALAEGAGTEAEAQAAMEMAHSLLAKHNISMSDVEAQESDPKENLETDDSTPLPLRNASWRIMIYAAIAELYFCRCFTRKSRYYKTFKICIVGKPSNVQVVHAVAQSIIHLGEKLSKQAGAGLGRGWANSFKIGYSYRISQRADEQLKKAMRGDAQDETGTALTIAPLYDQERKAIAAYLSQTVPDLRSRNNSPLNIGSADGYYKGVSAGNEASLSSNGIPQSEQRKMISGEK